ncbi:AtpZ/AtpI family protein [Chloroflexota bacterium]
MMLVRDVEAGMYRWQAALRLIGVGWFIGISILLGVLAGLWLDDRFDTKPLFVIVGLILGIIIAFYGVYRMILPNINKKQTKGKS